MENTAINVSVAGYTRLVRMDVHVDIDIVIRDSTGAVRATLATEVANSTSVTDEAWQTFTATYSFSEYTVVDDTDYLEVDLYADADTNTTGESVSLDFRLDDNSLSTENQTRISVRYRGRCWRQSRESVDNKNGGRLAAIFVLAG